MRLINADALIEILKRNKQFFIDAWGGSFHAMSERDKARYDEIDNCIATILNAPTIDSRQRGEWIFEPKDAIELMFTKPKCSKCGFESADGGYFCSHCGADMRGEELDETD